MSTARVASQAGAEVWREPRRGKGRAIATAFARLEEDVVLMVDGDGSYPAAGGRLLLSEFERDPADMITGLRTPETATAAFRPFHRFGGAAFAWVFRLVFRYEPGDLFSSKALAGGVEIAAAREALAWPHAPFEVPQAVYDAWDAKGQGQALEKAWNALFDAYSERYPAEAAQFERRMPSGRPSSGPTNEAGMTTGAF